MLVIQRPTVEPIGDEENNRQRFAADPTPERADRGGAEQDSLRRHGRASRVGVADRGVVGAQGVETRRPSGTFPEQAIYQ